MIDAPTHRCEFTNVRVLPSATHCIFKQTSCLDFLMMGTIEWKQKELHVGDIISPLGRAHHRGSYKVMIHQQQLCRLLLIQNGTVISHQELILRPRCCPSIVVDVTGRRITLVCSVFDKDRREHSSLDHAREKYYAMLYLISLANC